MRVRVIVSSKSASDTVTTMVPGSLLSGLPGAGGRISCLIAEIGSPGDINLLISDQVAREGDRRNDGFLERMGDWGAGGSMGACRLGGFDRKRVGQSDILLTWESRW